MSRVLQEPTASSDAELKPWQFGAGVDPREAGRKGGRASGLSRRLRPQRQLEEGIVESRNGAAKAKLLEIRMRRERELEQERIRMDAAVARAREERWELEDVVNGQRRRLAWMRRRGAEIVAALEAMTQTPEGLAELLADVPEDRLAAALELLGHEFVDDEETAA